MGNKYKRQKRPRKRTKRSKLTYKQYSEKCRFRFDIREYPDEFDYNLLVENGWYSEDNPHGITKDHMLSISYGWKRDIPPRIIKHPANCKLMLFDDNLEKGWRSSINYDELINRIKQWDRKYDK